MNDLKRPLHLDAFRPDGVEGLLRRFFRSEMPDPWPAPGVPQADTRRKPGRRFVLSSRLALAATVCFFLVGYLCLSGAFPRRNEPSRPSLPGEIGKGLDHKSPLHRFPAREVPRNGEIEQQGFVPLPLEIVPLRNGGQAELTGHLTEGPRRKIYLHLKLR